LERRAADVKAGRLFPSLSRYFDGAVRCCHTYVVAIFSKLHKSISKRRNPAPTEKQPSGYGTILTSYVDCSGQFIDRHGVGITALATIIIAAFTCTLWIATGQQAQFAKDAFIADKRAFVFASGIQPLYEPNVVTGHFDWRIGPIWHNSGDTPTRGLRIYTDGFLSNIPISPTFDFNQINPNVPPGSGMLGPKMSSGGGQAPHMPGAALTPQDILDIQAGTKFFYLWGWARYSDTLPEAPQRITRYCSQRAIH